MQHYWSIGALMLKETWWSDIQYCNRFLWCEAKITCTAKASTRPRLSSAIYLNQQELTVELKRFCQRNLAERLHKVDGTETKTVRKHETERINRKNEKCNERNGQELTGASWPRGRRARRLVRCNGISRIWSLINDRIWTTSCLDAN